MSRIANMKEFFECTNTVLLAFKREDPKGFEQVADGIEDGTFTYGEPLELVDHLAPTMH